VATTGRDLLANLRQSQNLSEYRKTHWEGSFEDYLDIIRQNPAVTRTAYDPSAALAVAVYSYVNDVPELALRVVCDTHFHDLGIVALPYPLVIRGVAELFGYAGHGTGAYNRSARGASPAPSSSLNVILS